MTLKEKIKKYYISITMLSQVFGLERTTLNRNINGDKNNMKEHMPKVEALVDEIIEIYEKFVDKN